MPNNDDDDSVMLFEEQSLSILTLGSVDAQTWLRRGAGETGPGSGIFMGANLP